MTSPVTPANAVEAAARIAVYRAHAKRLWSLIRARMFESRHDRYRRERGE